LTITTTERVGVIQRLLEIVERVLRDVGMLHDQASDVSERPEKPIQGDDYKKKDT